MTRRPRSAAPFAILLALAACHAEPEANGLDAIDNQLVGGQVAGNSGGAAPGNASDAELRSVIHVDPAHLRAKAAAPAPSPAASTPASANAATGDDCLGRYRDSLSFGAAWATKLPAEFPLPPGARLSEAAGHDGGCTVRAASFTVATDRDALLGWYAGKARAAGYDAGRETRGPDELVAGTKGAAAFAAIMGRAKAGGTSVDFIWARPD